MNKKIYKPLICCTAYLFIILTVCFAPFDSPGDSLTGSLTERLSKPAWAKTPLPCLSTLFPHEKSDLEPDPALIFGRLPNGFRYVLMENHEPEDRVSLKLDVQAGSLHETDDQQGLAHYLEHMLFNGSEHFAPGELIKYFQSIGMQFGADTNGYTSLSETVYDILLPTGTRESLEKGLVVIQDYARGALLPESEIERERGIILAEKRMRDSVSYRTYVSATQFSLAGSKIANRFPIGTEACIKSADQKLLKTYYDTWYRPENMILVMVGDFEPDVAVSLIKSKFSDLSAGALPQTCPEMGTIEHHGIKTFYHFEKEAGNTEVAIQTIQSITPKPDSFAYQKEKLTQYVANSIFNHRLNAMMEKPDNPFTDATASSGIYLNYIRYAEISAESAPENWKKVLMLLEQSLRQVIEFGFTASELERVKKEYLAELETALLKKDTRDSSHLCQSIIRNFNDDKVFQSPDQEAALYEPVIKSLTPDEVHQAFVDAWNQDHRLILVTGNAVIASNSEPDEKKTKPENEEEIESESEEKQEPENEEAPYSRESENPVDTPEMIIKAAFEKSCNTTINKPLPQKPIEFPYLPEPETPGKMLQRTEIFDLGTEQIDFENGVRLNLKQTNFKKNEVLAVISFGFGRKSEPVTGLAMLADFLLNKSGTGRLTQSELERALAGKNTSVRFEVEKNRFLLNGKSISEEVPLLFQLLHTCLQDPGYSDIAYLLAMRQIRQMYEQLVHSVEGAMKLSGEQFLAGGDPRFGMPSSYEVFQQLTLEQVRSWIDPARNINLEISVVGDFDPETVRKLAARYFGSLPDIRNVKDKKESLTFPKGERLDIEVETELEKGMAVIGWLTDDFKNIHRVRRLSALGYIFSERLRVEIRENLGLTYSQYAYNDSSRAYEDYGVFRTVLSINPEKSEKIIQEVRTIASELARKHISEDELRRAIDPLMTALKDMVRSNNYWLNTVLVGSLEYPRQLDWSRTIQSDYAAITIEDIAEMAKTYLKDKEAAVVVIVPKKDQPKKDDPPEKTASE